MEKKLHFRVHTPNLITEIASNNVMAIMKIPLRNLQMLLAEVSGRCAEINDPVLNRLMFDLTLYELPSPTDPAYSQLMDRLYSAEKKYRKDEAKKAADLLINSKPKP